MWQHYSMRSLHINLIKMLFNLRRKLKMGKKQNVNSEVIKNEESIEEKKEEVTEKVDTVKIEENKCKVARL